MRITTIMFGTMLSAGFATCAIAQQPAAGKDSVDASKVRTVDDWAKRKGAKEVWVNNPQAPRQQKQVAGKDAVDTNKVETVNDWAKRKGATEVWVNNPQAPRAQAQARNSGASPVATTGAEPVRQVASNHAAGKPKHAKKSKKKNIRPHAPPVQPAADSQ